MPAATAWASPCSTPPAITPAASWPLPCKAITGRSGPVWPGGRAIAQFVATPPRAAETKEPSTYVGCTAAGGGSSGGGARGAPAPAIDTGGAGVGVLCGCRAGPQANRPAPPPPPPQPQGQNP